MTVSAEDDGWEERGETNDQRRTWKYAKLRSCSPTRWTLVTVRIMLVTQALSLSLVLIRKAGWSKLEVNHSQYTSRKDTRDSDFFPQR